MLHIQEDVILPPSVFHKLICLPDKRKRIMLLNVYSKINAEGQLKWKCGACDSTVLVYCVTT
jgi:hypothetical protein